MEDDTNKDKGVKNDEEKEAEENKEKENDEKDEDKVLESQEELQLSVKILTEKLEILTASQSTETSAASWF